MTGNITRLFSVARGYIRKQINYLKIPIFGKLPKKSLPTYAQFFIPVPAPFIPRTLSKPASTPFYRCNFSFFDNNSSTVSLYISSGTQQSTGQTAAHCGSS